MKTADQIALYRQIDAAPDDADPDQEPYFEQDERVAGTTLLIVWLGLIASGAVCTYLLVRFLSWLGWHVVQIIKHLVGG